MKPAHSTKKQPLTAIDVFAGVGGMSLGAQLAGFTVEAAVEIDQDAAATFKLNHPQTKVYAQDIRALSGDEIAKSLTQPPDIIIGCAPCQGFCSLTSKWGREDERNLLVLELVRLAEELRPRVLVMENVPGVLTRGKVLFEELCERLTNVGYNLTWKTVQMADYGVPQNRRRLVLVAARDFHPSLPAPTHAKSPEADSQQLRWRTVRDAIYGFGAPVTFGKAKKNGGGQAHNWHIVRELKPDTRARLKAALPGKKRVDIDKKLLPACHQDGYAGFNNVYTRMDWSRPSPTITAGCLTPAKGRFGHPDRRRSTISLREAARIQTFPDSFAFSTDRIDSACQMVGNAVPPLFAKALLSHVRKQLLDAPRGE